MDGNISMSVQLSEFRERWCAHNEPHGSQGKHHECQQRIDAMCGGTAKDDITGRNHELRQNGDRTVENGQTQETCRNVENR